MLSLFLKTRNQKQKQLDAAKLLGEDNTKKLAAIRGAITGI